MCERGGRVRGERERGVRDRGREGERRGERDLWDDDFLLPPPAVFDDWHAILGSLLRERVWSASVSIVRYSEHCHYIVTLSLQ